MEKELELGGLKFKVAFEDGVIELTAKFPVEELMRELAKKTETTWDDKALDILFDKD